MKVGFDESGFDESGFFLHKMKVVFDERKKRKERGFFYIR